jgi:K(+)-stimulated pyrophosphate-energized sodium pump
VFEEHISDLERLLLVGILLTAIAGLAYALFLTRQVLNKPTGTPRMREVAETIRIGANAYLNRQFRTIAVLIAIITVVLFFTAFKKPEEGGGLDVYIGLGRSLAFVMGAVFSAMAGGIGMNMAVRGNVRVAEASRHSFSEALSIAYRTGTITGMLIDGLGLLGGTLIFMVYGTQSPQVLLGFGFGGTLLALFMRVGGGIYTKAADVGADLVGKVEANIPEDDERNAAVIADNVGDNVGDCAGMAADIFESYEVTIVSAMILGLVAYKGSAVGVIFPLVVRAIGVLSSIIGTYAVRARGELENAMRAIHRGFFLSAAISIIGFIVFGQWYFSIQPDPAIRADAWRVWVATGVGVLLAVTINYLTEYFTHTERTPVKEIARATQTGPATTILSGIAVGYESTVWAIFVIAVAIAVALAVFQGDPNRAAFGVALTGIGMLTLTGNNISMDVFGPVADNANGIGEMAHLEPNARKVLADLDAVGNTTKAITKGIAIGSAVVAAVSLFRSYYEESGLDRVGLTLDIGNPNVFIGLLIGGAIPWLFSALIIRAVGRASYLIVNEVRRQFRTIPGLWEGKAKADYATPVSICTAAAQRELIPLGLLAVLAPVVVGFALGARALGAFLGGAILSGQLLAVYMANAGGAWDNAKKTIEDGLYGGKGSDAHKAGVIGDTVGDPLKDTAGPALNPMLKVINLVAVLIAPLVSTVHPVDPNVRPDPMLQMLAYIGVAIALVILGVAIWTSKKESFGSVQVEAALSAQPLTPVTSSGSATPAGPAGRVGAPGGS